MLLPYNWRVPLCGWIFAHVVSPYAGYGARVRENLAFVWPDLPKAEVRRMVRAVTDNVGRSFIEMYSGPAFAARAAALPIEGEGLAALEAARAAGRPVVLVTGHFGNYDASRAALAARGFRIGGLYKPMKNKAFNAHYVRAMAQFGEPLFPRGRSGLADMVRHLKAGGMLGMVIDQAMQHGAELSFLGKPAKTALSAADLALKYDALLVPSYGIRQPDGLSFRIIVEPPIPVSDARTMTQALNDSLGALVQRHPDQWFWIHRRWK
jgi:KDO2-lipid IV(A) lauroyltransferase